MELKDISALAKGYFADSKTIMRNVTETEKDNQDLRSIHRVHKRGYSNDRERSMRLIGQIPEQVYFLPEFRKTYFAHGMDMHERRKNLMAFLKKHPEYLTVDKL